MSRHIVAVTMAIPTASLTMRASAADRVTPQGVTGSGDKSQKRGAKWIAVKIQTALNSEDAAKWNPRLRLVSDPSFEREGRVE